METPTGSSKTWPLLKMLWKIFLQLRWSVPYLIFLIILRRNVRYVDLIKQREENAWSSFRSAEKSSKLFWIVGDRPEYFSVLFERVSICLYFPKFHPLENK